MKEHSTAATPLDPITQKFILHWGEMSSRWGINRTMAQIHALLYTSPRPLNAEDIAGALSVARSNVSNSLKELQGWGIVRVVHVLGDRRDHFESLKDVWEMFRIVLDQRMHREVAPTLTFLRACVTETTGKGGNTYTRERLVELQDFFETAMQCYEQVRKLPPKSFVRLARMGDKVAKLLRLSGG